MVIWKRTQIKKIMVSSISSFLLAGQLLPAMIAIAETEEVSEEIEQVIEEESYDEEQENSQDVSDEEIEEQDEALIEGSEEINIELTINFDSAEEVHQAFVEFISNLENYTEAELRGYVEAFSLFIDDEEVIHSEIEVFDYNKYQDEELTILINILHAIREENIQKSLEDEDQLDDLSIDYNNEIQAFNNSVMTSSSQSTVNRLAGETRFQTATQISRQGWNSSPTVVIANSHEFADALAGVPLATITNSPILLVPSHAVPQETLNEIKRLGSIRAIILGGEHAVSRSVENTLRNNGLSVTRYAGENRYETAEAIANEVRRRTGANEAFLVSGEDFADAMSIAAIAGQRGAPIYLSRSHTLAGQVRNAASDYNSWTVVGGVNALSQNVYNVLGNQGASNRRRLAGETRYGTNLAVLRHYGISGNHGYVATGNDFVDALTGSVLAGRNNSGVLLVNDSDSVLQNAINFSETQGLTRFTLFGGVHALSSNIAEVFRYMRLAGSTPYIVIDPGHGGHDPGPVYGGVSEAQLNLQTARYLYDILDADSRYEVTMTRFSNDFIPLTDRARRANNLDADIFISIHYNAIGGANAGTARGIETFVQHAGGYTTNRNAFSSNPRIQESLRLADNVQSLLVSRTGLRNRGVRGNNLNVLRNTEMPAILVELGFMDNPTELSIIRTQQYRSTAAHAIRDGINRYFGY